jgi:DNA-binding MarR family transcriptional regulator
MDRQERIAIDKSLRVLQLLQSVDPDITLGAALCFLKIAQSDGMSIGDLRTGGEFVQSSATRYAQYLGKGGVDRRLGVDLVSVTRDPLDGRRKVLRANERGQLLAQQIGAALRVR